MQKRRLGRSGLEVSALGFGCGAVGGLMVRGERAEQVRSVGRALEAGINYFDTAPSYGDGASERNLGHALRELGRPAEVLVGTKVGLSGEDLARPRQAIRRSLEASLARLGLDRVDVLYLHNQIDAQTEAALGEISEGFGRAVEEGLARHAGFTAVGRTQALHRMAADPAYEACQAYLNVLNPSAVRAGARGGQQDFEGLIGWAAEHATGVVAIRVYAAGALTAGPERHPHAHLPPRPLVPGSDYATDVERARGLERTLAELGVESPLELGLRFALSAPGVSTALVGLSTIEHLEAAIRWAERGPLPPDQFERLLA
ncbi:MAG TPA: aldo/keto reductase [Candidatus Acidoferrales bacterium]|nr:aldo/keto reductase [Candidatus Acidoferrales bacterium]